MFGRILQCAITGLAVAFVALSMSAQSEPLTATIDLHATTQVTDKTLAPGEYHVVFEGDQAGNNLCAFVSPVKNERRAVGENGGKIRRAGTVVAEIPCALKTGQNVADTDAAVTSQDRLSEVRFKGKSETVDFEL